MGFEYASKLTRMLRDTQVSTDLATEYRTYCASRQIAGESARMICFSVVHCQ